MTDQDQTILLDGSVEGELRGLYGANHVKAPKETPSTPFTPVSTFTMPNVVAPKPPTPPKTPGLSFSVMTPITTPIPTPTSEGETTPYQPPLPVFNAGSVGNVVTEMQLEEHRRWHHDEAKKFYNEMLVLHPMLKDIPHAKWKHTPSTLAKVRTVNTLPGVLSEFKAALLLDCNTADKMFAAKSQVEDHKLQSNTNETIKQTEDAKVNPAALANAANARTTGDAPSQPINNTGIEVVEIDEDQLFACEMYQLELLAANGATATGYKFGVEMPNLVPAMKISEESITGMWLTAAKRYPDHPTMKWLKNNPLIFIGAAHALPLNALFQDLFLTRQPIPVKKRTNTPVELEAD